MSECFIKGSPPSLHLFIIGYTNFYISLLKLITINNIITLILLIKKEFNHEHYNLTNKLYSLINIAQYQFIPKIIIKKC